MVGSGIGARQGILFKTAASLETTGYTDTVVLDKTGTITTGEPSVVEVVGTRNVPAKFLLGLAAGLEARSEHPLAKAVLRKADADGVRCTRPGRRFPGGAGQGPAGQGWPAR